MAWEEWEQLKSAATEQDATRMQLNRLPDEREDRPAGGGGGANGDLTVDHQDLVAVGNSAFKLFEGLGNHGRDAWSSSQTAAKDLTTQEFELGAALHVVQDRWEKSLKTLLDACAHISNHMDSTKNAHAGDSGLILGIVGHANADAAISDALASEKEQNDSLKTKGDLMKGFAGVGIGAGAAALVPTSWVGGMVSVTAGGYFGAIAGIAVRGRRRPGPRRPRVAFCPEGRGTRKAADVLAEHQGLHVRVLRADGRVHHFGRGGIRHRHAQRMAGIQVVQARRADLIGRNSRPRATG